MDKPFRNTQEYFQAFIRTAQYIPNLTTRQDILSETGRVLIRFFGADLVGFFEPGNNGGIEGHHWILPDGVPGTAIQTRETEMIITEVLETGFLAAQHIDIPKPFATVFLPITWENQTAAVMLIGHRTSDPIPKELLNIYLAVAGLVTNAITGADEEFKNIAARKHAEEALKEAQAQLAFLVSSTPVVLYRCSASGDFNVTFISDNVQLQLGYEAHEFMDDPAFWPDHIHPDDREHVFERLHRLIKDGTATAEYRLLGKDGTYRWTHDEARVGRDANDQPVEFLGYWIDITKRKHAELALIHSNEELNGLNEELNALNEELTAAQEEMEMNNEELMTTEKMLRESEARLALALDISGMGTLDCDMVNHTSWRSLRHDQIFGYETPPSTWNLKIFFDHVLPEDREMVRKVFCDAFASQSNWSFECRIRRADGEIRWIEKTGLGQYDNAGRPLRVLGLLLDITERKQFEATQEEYAEKLMASNEELQRYAYVASHDLQEPLRSIVSFSELLNRRYRGKLDKDADEYIRFIVDGGVRMQNLIKDLLQVSRIETQAQPFAPTDARTVVADSIRSLETPIHEISAVVTVDPLPIVMADPSQLEQVFTNLIGNAIKYRRPEVPPVITISAERYGDWWEFSVRDNGIGIESEFFDRIFEMFRRLHTIDEYEGTGIGLAIVKRIVERHGGRIRVESKPGEGSTFFFTLPNENFKSRVDK
ncbi:sensor histidine kinase [Methanosphaerula palustris]|nr:PAS domain-containing protein [Methanosphaerula palustris]